MSHSEERALRAPPKPLSRIALAGLGLAVLAALAALLPGPAYRFGGWSLDTAFAALRWAVYAGMGAVVVAIIGAILARPGGPYRGFPYAVAGVLISLVVVGVPLAYLLIGVE
jgi:multisubunit Na+/H+ antiporter MnhB subunit